MILSRLITFFKNQLLRYKKQQSITSFDIVVFWRQFAALLTANVSIIQICDILEKSQRKIVFCLLIKEIKRELLRGKNLFQSLCRHTIYFDELTCHLIRIGEHTGKLDLILCTIADHQEKMMLFRKKIKKALFYPCIITIVTLALTFFMFMFVVPRFADLFKDSITPLPLVTMWIFFISEQLNQHFLFILFVLLIITLIFYLHFPRLLKNKLQHIAKQLPLISTCLHKITLARFARNLSIAFSTGIPIKEALQLSMSKQIDEKFTQAITLLTNKINAGLSLHHAMTTLTDFPDIMIQMIKIGEETGMLDQMLNKTADFFESEIDLLLDQLGLLLEPLIMIILGVLIGGLVVSMYLPVFNLGSAL
ncbi:MAG: type II secretion system F family protein [Gammaproteobacteria bacterium]|nr:type II secretion system F family protein [Gammaproteobacteria bacterium]